MLNPAPTDVVDRATVIEVAADRCDAKGCGAQAFVYATYPTGSLAYCGHHGTEYLPRLYETAVTVIDQRFLIGS